MGRAELKGLILGFLRATGPQELCDIRSYCQRNSRHLITRTAVHGTLRDLAAEGQVRQDTSPDAIAYWSISDA